MVQGVGGLRQALCLIYGGDHTLRRANAIIRDGLTDEVIDNPEGVCILAGIIDCIPVSSTALKANLNRKHTHSTSICSRRWLAPLQH